jgi:tripartite-type tricarboxylate transporter receptor subunit TctC
VHVPIVNRVCGLCAAAALLFPSAPSHAADSVTDFYRGKNLEFVIGYPPGSGYDVYGRALARHIARHLPGEPTVVVQNMPGAGSLKAANYIYNVAPKDGTAIGAINRSLATASLLETVPEKKAKLKFDPLKLNWIGSTDKATSIAICRDASGFKTFDQVFKKEAIATAAAPTSDSVVYPTVLNNMLGTKFRIVSGHQGSGGNFLALERGEADCYLGTTYSSVESLKPDWMKPNNGFMTVIVQISAEKDPHLPNVPLVMQYANDMQRKALTLLLSTQSMGRPYMAPPGVPKERVAALRAAFDATMKDARFRTDAKKTGISVDPMGGTEIGRLLEDIYATDKAVVETMQKAMPKQG